MPVILPAVAARLQVGDVIKAVNGQPVSRAETLQKLLDENGINHQLKLEVERQNGTIEVKVKPESLPAQA